MQLRITGRSFRADVLAPAAVALSLALSPVTADAQQGARMPDFGDLDTDGDGFVSESELAEFRAQRMAQRAAEGRPMARTADAPMFADLDADADGKISPEELQAFHQQRGRAGAGPGSGRGAGPGQAGPRRQVATFEEIDLNGDGCIDREELAEHHRVRGRAGS